MEVIPRKDLKMRQDFNNSFSLINDINAVKENISNELELLESIEKIEKDCESDNKNISSISIGITYISNGANTNADSKVRTLLGNYIKDNFFAILGKIKEEKVKTIDILEQELSTKAQELEQETNK